MPDDQKDFARLLLAGLVWFITAGIVLIVLVAVALALTHR